MLVVNGLSKHFVSHGETRVLFKDLSFEMARNGRVAVLGRNGQGKSTLIKILGGVLAASSGKIKWDMSASWPLGFSGAFQGGMSGIDNIKFLSRIYDRPYGPLFERVERFAELGDYALKMPIKYYSSGMRARLAFGLSIAIEFDCYLIDEVFAVGDVIFRGRCEDELFGKRADRAFIVASHDMEFIKAHCQTAIVVDSGRAKAFDDLDLAVDIYAGLCAEEAAFVENRMRVNA